MVVVSPFRWFLSLRFIPKCKITAEICCGGKNFVFKNVQIANSRGITFYTLLKVDVELKENQMDCTNYSPTGETYFVLPERQEYHISMMITRKEVSTLHETPILY